LVSHLVLFPRPQWPPTRLVEQHFPPQVDIGQVLAREGPVRAAHAGFDHLTDEQRVVPSSVRGDQTAIERGQGIPQPGCPRTTALQRQRGEVIWPLGLGRVKIVFQVLTLGTKNV